jgi:hypothetical protein
VTEEEWGALVERLERQAEANPSRYARKVLLFGLLGYAVLGAALLVLVGLAAGIAYLAATETLLIGKAIIPLAGLAWVIVRALGAKVDPPEGFALSTSEAPALFEMIDHVRERVKGPARAQGADRRPVQCERRPASAGARASRPAELLDPGSPVHASDIPRRVPSGGRTRAGTPVA